MYKKILIADDVAMNRAILTELLRDDYEVLEASCGEEALELLGQSHGEIAAVLLDIDMPGIDGYEVLRRIRATAAVAHLPVIMITGSNDEETRVTSLTLGANDFVIKPYSGEIIRHCLKNNIAFSEAAATVSAMQRDRLTGLYNREAFLDQVGEAVSHREAGYYIMACFDIDKFKVINDQYGTAKGDEVLQHAAAVFREGFTPHGGICCRISADNFAVLYPRSFAQTAEIADIRRRSTMVDGLVSPISFSVGRYVIDDLTLSPAAMYDRAMLAAASIKGRVDSNIALYDETMRERLIREQEIVSEMTAALEGRQFEPWFQPQYNHSTGMMIGAEALVRWRHPQKGLISPGVFIPIFEQNGFIYSLDKYIWEEVCRYLRKWLDQGLSPLPVSVNISRYDILRADLVETVSAIVRKYSLPMELLRLEITESAFSESPERIVSAVMELIASGFTVEIDDFGSGYSSLNTLKDVPAQIIKLDMKFLESASDSRRGGNIVESVVRMAKWLGVSVIAEGVETVEQADFLRSIGCSYIQGYLYARPMPAENYETHCRGTSGEERLLGLETVENLDNNAFWDPKSLDTLIFNSYVGGACIYEYHRGKVELLRATEKYARLIGNAEMTVEEVLRIDLAAHLDGASKAAVQRDIEESARTGGEVTGEYVFLDLPGCPHATYLRSTMRIIASAGERYLVYCTNENITAQRESEARERSAAEQLRAVMENIGAGVTATVVENGEMRMFFANNTHYEHLGCAKSPGEMSHGDILEGIHPDDRAAFIEHNIAASESGAPTCLVFRIIRTDGDVRWIRSTITVIRYPGIASPVLLAVATDITDLRKAELHERETSERLRTVMANMNGGVSAVTLDPGGKVVFAFANDQYFRILGYTREQFTNEVEDPFSVVHPDDAARLRDTVNEVVRTRRSDSYEYRCIKRDGSVGYLRCNAACTDMAGVSDTVLLSVITDVTAIVTARQSERQTAERMQSVMESVNCGISASIVNGDKVEEIFVNDRYYELSGYTPAQFAAEVSSPFDLVHPDDMPKVAEAARSANVPGVTAAIEYRLTRRDQREIWLQTVISTRMFEGIEEPVQVCVYSDITESKLAAEQLRAITESIDCGVTATAIGTDGRTMRQLFANDRYFEFFGCTRKEYAAGSTESEHIIPEDRAKVLDCCLSVLAGGEPGTVEFRVTRRDGAERWLKSSIALMDYPGEKERVQLSVTRDITEFLEAERMNRSLSEQLHAIMADIGSGVTAATIDDAGCIDFLFANDKFYELHGYTREQYESEIGDKFLCVHPDDREKARRDTVAAYTSRTPAQLKYRLVMRDGEVRHVRVDLSSTHFTGIEQNVHLCIFTDITAERMAEREITAASEQLRTMMDDMPGGFARIRILNGGALKLEHFNNGMSALTGMSHDELYKLYGEDIFAGVHPDDLPAMRKSIALIFEGMAAPNYRYRLRHGNGGYAWFSVFGRVTRDAAGNSFLNIYFTDASAQAREEELHRSLLDNLPGGAGIYEYKDGRLSVIYLNRSYWSLVGRTAGDYRTIEPLFAVHPDDLAIVSKELASAVRSGRDMLCDIRLRVEGGGYRAIRIAGHIVPVEGGYLLYMVFSDADAASASYQQSLTLLLGALMDYTSDLSFAKDKHFRYLSASRAFALMAGQESADAIVGKTDYDIFELALAEKYRRDDEALLASGKAIVDAVESIPAADGRPRYSSTSKYILRDGTGRVVGLYGVGRDITRAVAQDSQLKLLAASIPGGLATYSYTDGNLRVVYCNEGFCELFGGTVEGFASRGDFDPMEWVFEDDLPELLTQIDSLVRDDKPVDCTFRVHTVGGGYNWINERAALSERSGTAVVFNAILLNITEQQNSLERLRISEEENNLAVRLGGSIVCRFTVADRTLVLAPDVARANSLPEFVRDVPEGPVRLGMISEESAEAYIGFFESILHGAQASSAIFCQRYLNGWHWLEAKSTTIFSDDGKPVKAVISFTDVTERLEKETIYRKWQQSLEDRAPESYTLFRCNLNKNTTYDSREGALFAFDIDGAGGSFNERARAYAAHSVHADDAERYVAFANSDAMLASYYRGRRSDTLEYRELLGDGGWRWLRLSVDLVEYPNSTDVEAYLMYEDIDAGKRAELETKALSETDPLTGLLNRTAFAARVDARLASSPPGTVHALLMMDIDGFKRVNDVFGHGAGDRLLIEIADSLRGAMRREDLICRLGGDEFVAFLSGVHSGDDALAKARRIRAAAARSFGAEVRSTMSIGIALAPGDGASFVSLYEKADSALYFVKGSGKDSEALYCESMAGALKPGPGAAAPEEKRRRMLIVDDNSIDHAMLHNIFKDDFIIETASDGTVALARLRHYGSEISVVLLDLMMPGTDGFAVLARMQESDELSSIPVIIVSGDDSRDTCLDAIRKGATDFVTKPVNADILRIRVRSAISKAEGERSRIKNLLV